MTPAEVAERILDNRYNGARDPRVYLGRYDAFQQRAVDDALEAIVYRKDETDASSLFEQVMDDGFEVVDVYNADLAAWLNEREHVYDLNDAIEEYGWPDGGLYQAIQIAQQYVAERVLHDVCENVCAIADDTEGVE